MRSSTEIRSLLAFASGLWLLLGASALAVPRLNEIVADNAEGGLLDQDGDLSDWIEIFNAGPGAVDLSGYFLTDDAERPNKWAFPSLVMPEESSVLVFASSKDRARVGSELHSNFSLSAGGEYLALTKADAEIGSEFAPSFPELSEGLSYGIDKDGSTLGYFEKPTSSAANGTALLGYVADIERGFFTEPIMVSLTSSTPDAAIIYTTNGAAPTLFSSTKYTGPITIAETTTLRAVASKKGYFPTELSTQTYLFLDDVRTQYADGCEFSKPRARMGASCFFRTPPSKWCHSECADQRWAARAWRC